MTDDNDLVEICDFTRSFIRWRIDTTKKQATTVSRKLPMTLINIRIPLECCAQITAPQAKRATQYVLCSSCKSEQVWVKRDIWHQPNADLCVFASRDQFLGFKRWDRVDKGVMRYPPSLGVQPERQLVDPAEAFDSFSIDINKRNGRRLNTIDQIIEVIGSSRPIVAQTEYDARGYHILLEYPVKTANFSERERYYQVDTGPVLLPDLDGDYHELIEGFRIAYIAHNCAEWAEFIVNVPTPLTPDIKVHHYSIAQRIEGTTNCLIEVL